MLGILRDKQLYAKLSKCEFWMEKVQFLGHVISAQGLAIDLAKVEVVIKWEHPKSEIKSFVGLAGYYRRFIEGFSKIVKTLGDHKTTKMLLCSLGLLVIALLSIF